jgi:hypothetical protein
MMMFLWFIRSSMRWRLAAEAAPMGLLTKAAKPACAG